MQVIAPTPSRMIHPGILAIRRARGEGLRPALPMQVSTWADRHRFLPKKSSAEPGPWRTDRTPYLAEIMDCFSTMSEVEEVIFMKGAQVGGTEAILNALGYVIDHAPGPVIFIQPTVELAKRFSRQRVDPLCTLTPSIQGKVAPARQRDSGNTMLSKDFPGGQLVITGANSAVGLRSMPAQVAFMDEIDGYPIDVDDEGSPIALVEARQRTFSRKKRAKVSTPTIDGRSPIQDAYEASDQRRYYLPCPDCGHEQPLEFGQLKWSTFGYAPEQAVYVCRACDYQMRNHQKTDLLARGRWIPERPERVGKIRGYHLSALYSPVGWLSWGDIATNFTRSYKHPEKYRVFVNTILGDTWKLQGDAPEWMPLMNRRDTYAIGTVPLGVLLLTLGVDVQKDRLVYEVVGWGREKRSWSIDVGEIVGDTADLEKGPWHDLDALIDRTFPHVQTGALMAIERVAVDSGFNTQTVYTWSKRYPISRVIPIKGTDKGGVLVGSPSLIELTGRGTSKRKRGGRVWPVCVPIAKSELYGWLRLEVSPDGVAPPGYCRWPQYGPEYFKQLTSEQLVPHRTKRGFIRLEWEQIPGRENHGLDARIYARGAAFVAGLDRFQDKDWAARERAIGVVGRDPSPDQSPPSPVGTPTATAKRPTPERQRSGWLGTRRSGSWLKERG